jgi:hypothetical protein
MNIGSQMQHWAIAQYLKWSHNDPVSTKETDRNNAIYGIQDNRNPFIDHPEWADSIWADVVSGIALTNVNAYCDVYPNPALTNVNISFYSKDYGNLAICLFAADGSLVIQKNVDKNSDAILESIDLSNLSKGVYVLQLKTATAITTKMVVKE